MLYKNLDVIAELERVPDLKFSYSGEASVKFDCPFHDCTPDSNSLSLDIEKQLFKCHVPRCKASGNIIKLLARFYGYHQQDMLAELATRYVLDELQIVDPVEIEEAHAKIFSKPVLVQELFKRGVDRDLIKKYRLGVNVKGDRITIPIPDASENWVNVRSYAPGAASRKVVSKRGHGKIKLFPVDQLEYSRVVITEGEVKAIVAANELNARGVGAITASGGGSDNWHKDFNIRFRGKHVYIIFDIDDAGRIGAENLASTLGLHAEKVYVIDLPLDKSKYPKGDINDYMAVEGKEVYPLIENAVEYVPPNLVTYDSDEEYIPTTLTAAVETETSGSRVEVKAVVGAMFDTPFKVPRRVSVNCPKNQDFCMVCPVMRTGDAELEIHNECPSLLKMCNSSDAVVAEAIQEALRIPRACNVCSFDRIADYSIEVIRVSPIMELTNLDVDRPLQPAIVVDKKVRGNETYKFKGRIHPHPKTQEATLVLSGATPTEDALSSYKPKRLERLKKFQPEGWTLAGLHRKLNAIYNDLEPNITRIFKRRKVHLLTDLAYHTMLSIKFDGKLQKGWSDILITGDSSNGKSATVKGLNEHYGLGQIVDCKAATYAGLVGGKMQVGNTWLVTWGKWPENDRGFMALEEVNGLSHDIIASLTHMRSSGEAAITGIIRKKAFARTRTIWVSNPRHDRTVASHAYGIEALHKLIGAPQDLRRFDICLVTDDAGVDPKYINMLASERPVVPHTHTSELCRALILWGWSRREPCEFSPDVTRQIMEAANMLCEKYTNKPPIVDLGDMRHKIARLAASLAVRTFSCSDDMQSVIVRPCHVEYIVELMQEIYDSEVFGYLAYTEAKKAIDTIEQPERVESRLKRLTFAKTFVQCSLNNDLLDERDFWDWMGETREAGHGMLSFLHRHGCLCREGRFHYKKTAPYVVMLKELLASGVTNDDVDGEF